MYRNASKQLYNGYLIIIETDCMESLDTKYYNKFLLLLNSFYENKVNEKCFDMPIETIQNLGITFIHKRKAYEINRLDYKDIIPNTIYFYAKNSQDKVIHELMLKLRHCASHKNDIRLFVNDNGVECLYFETSSSQIYNLKGVLENKNAIKNLRKVTNKIKTYEDNH